VRIVSNDAACSSKSDCSWGGADGGSLQSVVLLAFILIVVSLAALVAKALFVRLCNLNGGGDLRLPSGRVQSSHLVNTDSGDYDVQP
jgi:hypothetical protein